MWGLTSQNSFISGWHYCGFTRRVLIDDVRGKKWNITSVWQAWERTPKTVGGPLGFFAFEGSLFRLFKQGDAQWLQRRALAAADRGRDGDAIQLTQIRGDNKEILAETITLLQRGRKHAAPPPRRIRYCRSDETWSETSASKHHSRSGPLLIFLASMT